MKQIAEKYRALKPRIEYLSDEVIIAQAWKKTHGYIRSFNWYADTLALDISALTIEDNANKWAGQIKEGYPLNNLELVPAAKSETWLIDSEGWHPKDIKNREDKTPLRPLAHLTVRDQSWATAAMMCLADAVESAQGDCRNKNLNFETTRAKNVYSYGNRLVCEWKEGKAWFRWGNSETYRKFFTDYQNFLKRPLAIGRSVAEHQSAGENVYIINLDLEKFYNTIDVDVLIERLKTISTKFHLDKEPNYKVCPDFWNSFKRITDWRWSQDDLKLAETFNLGDIKTGLPQGLVAAGFFANAYLNEFDQEVGKQIGQCLPEYADIEIHDYCRYVDDLRLVVSAENTTPDEIDDQIYRFISKLLNSFGGSKLKVNDTKTKVTQLSDLDNSGSMTNRIEMIQNDLSGPADRDILDSTTGILENLLSIEDNPAPDIDSNHPDSALMLVANFDHDIRSDTLKRFAANRLESIVRSKRRIINIKTSDNSDSHRDEHEDSNELLAKKLIAAWMKDPSLGLVLRKAIEIYPDADLFEPVFDAIYSRSNFSKVVAEKNEVTAIMMDFLLADLFRCASDFHGYFQVISYPNNLTPNLIIELIARYAQKVLTTECQSLFTVRQALMLLAVTNKSIQLHECYDEEKAHASLHMQKALHSILVNNPPEYQAQRSALFEVAAQITGYFDNYASLFLEHIENLSDQRYPALEVFAKRGGPFWLSLWKQLKKKGNFKDILTKINWALPLIPMQPKAKEQVLSRVISSVHNGFEFEHALIKLAIGLIELSNRNSSSLSRSPNEIKLKIEPSDNWNELWRAEVKIIGCKVHLKKQTADPRFAIPDWIDDSAEDNKILYWVGTILRASVLGGTDFTGNQWKPAKTLTYKGLRTSWYKRRMGMMHSPESMVGEFSTVSDWFSDLLMRCLQWPGFESAHVQHEDVRNIIDIETFENCLKNRLDYLNNLICSSSALPVLPTKVSRPNGKETFRVVTVQQLLPRTNDFCVTDVELNNPAFRARHRDHLLTVCQLTVKTLDAKINSDGDAKKPSADLIVFPEVSVHIDDQDIIKRLADKTGAIIFAGLVFTDHKGKIVNIARWFIPDYRDSGRQWIVRDQGKGNMTAEEKKMGISPYRPCQHIIEVHGHPEGPFNITGTICYDATDISLAADLRGKCDLFIVVAHNKDVKTFDNMASGLHYHMYQHVVISNIGEFGGSTIQAPYTQPYDRLISHVHGVGQIAINTADIDLAAFKRTTSMYKAIKTKPAGIEN